MNDVQKDHFTLVRIADLCHELKVTSAEYAHMRECEECETTFRTILREQRDVLKRAALRKRGEKPVPAAAANISSSKP